jgi:hypothetical protein
MHALKILFTLSKLEERHHNLGDPCLWLLGAISTHLLNIFHSLDAIPITKPKSEDWFLSATFGSFPYYAQYAGHSGRAV